MEQKKMTRAEAQAFQEGWRIAKEIELSEAMSATYESRWRDLHALFNSAFEIGWIEPDSEEELEPIRSRWARLKEGYP